LRFKPLDPKTLSAAARRIRHQRRVVVVSACYSGGFAESLKEENTLVITASAPTGTPSAGSNEARFTLGKAYFDERCRNLFLRRGVRKGEALIAEREKKQDYSGAEPQIFRRQSDRAPAGAVPERRALQTNDGSGARTDPTSPQNCVEFRGIDTEFPPIARFDCSLITDLSRRGNFMPVR